MDARLEPPPTIEAAGVQECAGPGIRLVDQSIHLAEVSPSGAELDVGDQQADLSLV